MEKVTFVDATYYNSDNIEVQGSRDSIQKYLDQGYSIKKSHNDVYTLCKPTHIMVFLKNSDGKYYEFNITSRILRFYGKKWVNYHLFLNFLDDASRGRIQFYIENENCLLKLQ